MREQNLNNIKIFEDTQKQFETNKQLKEATEEAKRFTAFYSGWKGGPTNRFDEPCKVVISKKSSFDAARSYGGKVAVLNFASATNPGGGVTKGSSAQEECLCRCSNLYQCLNQKEMWDKFYNPHRQNGTPLHNDDMILSKVTIIKSDAYNNLYRPFVADVITCAAPNLRETPANAYNHERGEGVKISAEDLIKLHETRADNILGLAAANGEDHIIVGAFGCGAFKNPPELVARAWKNVIEKYRKSFKTIEFAIFSKFDTVNYDAFKAVLEG